MFHSLLGADPATTPQVQYAYSEGSGGNHSRLARITYPDGYQLDYAYTGLDAAVSRPTSLSGEGAGSGAAVTHEAFKYLGLGTVIERSRPEVNAALSMVSVTGATGDAGDKYTGLDRFGRVVDSLAAAFSETYVYDAWNRLVSVKNASGTEVARYGYDGLNRRVVEQTGTPAAPAAASAPIRDVYYSQEWQALEERVRTSPSQIASSTDTRFIWSPVYVDAMVSRDRNADGDAATGTGGLED